MINANNGPERYVEEIQRRGLTIYDEIEIDDPDLWIPSFVLKKILNDKLVGLSLANLPLRRRSKVIKEHICSSLGYPIPSIFRKTRPRFPGQYFDVYSQKSNNLQIWNEEISPTRRYVIIRVDNNYTVVKVKVVSGEDLARLDTTGTLTQKYQARLIAGNNNIELVSADDTPRIKPTVQAYNSFPSEESPVNKPVAGQLLPIDIIFEKLKMLVGENFPDTGSDQERNRGAALHALVCRYLGYANYRDDGRFPDIRHQLLEVKLQTSPTIDLGLVCPDSEESLGFSILDGQQVRHCDVRYALFYGEITGTQVILTALYVTTGEKFFTRFRKFQGNITNKKLQIPLPVNFFED